MTDKLKRKLARQAKQTERLMGGYQLTQKKATRVTFARQALWHHIDTTKVYYSHTKLQA